MPIFVAPTHLLMGRLCMNIFIAFATEDRDVRDKLLRQMNLVKDRQGWTIWSAVEIKAGDRWDAEIKQRLFDSNVVILLLSTDFFNSSYILDTELPEIIARHRKGDCQIIPVLARMCHWKDTAFGDYARMGDLQALPSGEKPIMSRMLWDNEDEPYFETVRGIKEAIADFQKKKNDEAPAAAPVAVKVKPMPAVSKKKTVSPKTSRATPLKKSKPAPVAAPVSVAPPKKTSLPVSLFPLHGVTLGKTTINELKQLGTHSTMINGRTKEPYNLYEVKGVDFWYDRGVAHNMYMPNFKKIPDKWRAIGFSWRLSYQEWMALFKKLGYETVVTKPPKTGEYQGKPCFIAEIMAYYQWQGIQYSLQLDFNYNTGVNAADSQTLYSIRVVIM